MITSTQERNIASYTFYSEHEQEKVFPRLERLMRHHDHVKQLNVIYQQMRHDQTYECMRDPLFQNDEIATQKLDNANFTSLIIPLTFSKNQPLFEQMTKLCTEFNELIQCFYPNVVPQINLDAAHITVRSIVDYITQSVDELREYLPIIKPSVQKWLKLLGNSTRFYFMGLFSNFQENKGLSVGLRIYPTLPLIQIIRGEVANILYELNDTLPVRPESQFHTSLTHSTLLRVRNFHAPLSVEFILAFKDWVEQYDTTVFGSMFNIGLADFRIRNGKSDKLLLTDETGHRVGNEICLTEGFKKK